MFARKRYNRLMEIKPQLDVVEAIEIISPKRMHSIYKLSEQQLLEYLSTTSLRLVEDSFLNCLWNIQAKMAIEYTITELMSNALHAHSTYARMQYIVNSKGDHTGGEFEVTLCRFDFDKPRSFTIYVNSTSPIGSYDVKAPLIRLERNWLKASIRQQ